MGIGRYHFLILLLVPILFSISINDVFAQEALISVNLSDNSYEKGEIIVISGKVTTVIPDTPVTIQIFNEGNLITIAQLVVAQDGSFTHIIDTGDPEWQNEGQYIVRASYGGGNIAEASFEFFKSTVVNEITDFFEVDGGNSGTFDVGYTISGGTVQNMSIDSSSFSLRVTIGSTADGSITLDLPRDYIDAKKSDGSDDIFIVLIDGIEISYAESITNQNTRTLTISFEQGDSDVGIFGTYIISGSQQQPPEEPEPDITVALSFVESSDFRTLAFNALPGEAGSNPTINANVGDKIRFDVVNDGKSFHAFGVTREQGIEGIIPGTEIASATDPLKPGESGSSEFIPDEEGIYYYVCTVPGHVEMGAIGKIIVGDVSPEPEPDSIIFKNPHLVNAFGNSISSVTVNQPAQIAADVTNTKSTFQDFVYVVLIQDSTNIPVSLGWITGSLNPGQTLNPALSWTPDSLQKYTITIHLLESLTNAQLLAVPLTLVINTGGSPITEIGPEEPFEPDPNQQPASSLTISTNEQFYETGDTILVSGKLPDLGGNNGIGITLLVKDRVGNLVFLKSKIPDSDWSYEFQFTADGTMRQPGEYEAIVQFGTQKESTEFDFLFVQPPLEPDPKPEPEPEPEPHPNSVDVSIPTGTAVPGCEETNECFIPEAISINVGDTVIWTNDDTAAHTVTSGSSTDGPDGIFDSSLFMAGATFEVTFDDSGSYDYFCMVHPWMQGNVQVGGQGGPTPIPPSVNVRTDQSTYHPGETVEVSGIVRHFDGRAVSLKIVNPFGSLVLVDQTELSSGGAFKEQYKIAGPQWTKSGSYTVTVQAGSAKAQTEFFLRIPSTTPPPSQQTTEIEAARGSAAPGCEETNQCFIPFEARVKVGQEVTWFNADSAAHTVTSGSAANGPNGIFDSSLFMAGRSFSHIFDTSGTFDYFCMVHPWMNGIIVVGEGGPVTPPRSDIRISLESRESVYDLGDLVQIDVSISGINSQEQVAITVTDRSGTSVISRTLTTDSSGDAVLEFRIPEDFRTGTYLVSATASIDGKTYKARDVFKIKSQFNQLRIISVEPTDQQGQPADFEAGELGFVKVVLEADKDIAVLITVNLFDSELTTLGIGSLKTTLNDGRTEMILSFMIPDDAALGEAEIFASVFSDWPRNGGIPLTAEFRGEVDIQRSF